MAQLTYKPINLGRRVVWGGFALLLVFTPLVFSSGASLSLLSQMGTMMIFGLSFNMLLGQGGMLSFGHAVYSGLGAFFAIHTLNLMAGGSLWLPVSLVPLVGGFAGMAFGILFGYVTTKKAGTTFSMITLGLVELVFASSLMFPSFFGGEGGISGNRVVGATVMGISFGPQIQVYYLIAAWLFLCTIAMFAFTQTPLGRLINAARDNPERAEFIGYDTQWLRYLTLILSAFFAGISGGLSAINFEIVSAENVSAIRSGAVLLFTFIGGIGFFFGPLIGAVVGVFLTVVFSELTKAWQLYLGCIFIGVVMYAPGGIASILMLNLRVLKFGFYKQLWPRLWRICVTFLLAMLGVVMAVEMLYHLQGDVVSANEMRFFGILIKPHGVTAWLVSATLFAVGAYLFMRCKAPFVATWGDINAKIEAEMQRVAQ